MTQPIRTSTFTSGDLVLASNVLGATATDTVAAVFTDGDLLVSVLLPSRRLTITRSLSTASYTTDAISVTLKDGTVDLIAQPNADGGDTLASAILIDNIKRIDFPAQMNTSGSITVGVDDIGPPRGARFAAVEMHTSGNLHVQYGEPSGGPTDVIPVDLDVRPRSHFEITPTRVVTRTAATNPTTVGVTVYY